MLAAVPTVITADALMAALCLPISWLLQTVFACQVHT